MPLNLFAWKAKNSELQLEPQLRAWEQQVVGLFFGDKNCVRFLNWILEYQLSKAGVLNFLDSGSKKMNRSEKYKCLVKELYVLRCHLLPPEFDPTGDYAPEILTRATMFRVLAHAEIESYIEERSWEIAVTAVNSWKGKKKTSRTLLGLLAFSDLKMEKPPNSLRPKKANSQSSWKNKLDISTKINQAMDIYHKAIENNHGIKEEHLLRLLLPVGFEANDLDPVWVADMSSFGEGRGKIVHTSASKWAKQQLDPKNELKIVKSLLRNGVRFLDKKMEDLLLDT
jgi:hypothetical protein